MTYNNLWLYEQLRAIAPAQVQLVGPLIHARYRDRVLRIYAPAPSEYVITVDVVQKVIGMGGNFISYAKNWSRPSLEAIEFAKQHAVELQPHGAILAMMKGQ